MRQPRLGVDFGRVINDATGADDTSFLGSEHDEAMRTPAMAGAFEVLARLVERFEGRVWIVSKCGERTQERTLQWLDHKDFWTETGVSRANARFCRQRSEKAIHCRKLGITHFVDDRRDVLVHLRDLVDHRYLFGPQDHPAPDWVTHTPTWLDVERAISSGSP